MNLLDETGQNSNAARAIDKYRLRNFSRSVLQHCEKHFRLRSEVDQRALMKTRIEVALIQGSARNGDAAPQEASCKTWIVWQEGDSS